MYTEISNEDMAKTLIRSILMKMSVDERVDFLAHCLSETAAYEYSIKYTGSDGKNYCVAYSNKGIGDYEKKES